MPPTQDNRQIGIETPLGKDVLLLRSATVTEQVGRLFQIDVDLLSVNHEVAFDELVGENVTIRLNLPGGGRRYFNGHVSRFIQTPIESGMAHYRAVVVPWLWFLTRTSDCRIFQNMTVPDIVEQIFQDAGFSDFENRLSATYRTWEYCVQYRETDFNFVSRLMEQEGIYYFFTHEEGKHNLILGDAYSAHETYPDYDEIVYRPPTGAAGEREAITDWVVEKSVQPGVCALNDFNYNTVNVSLLRSSNISREHAQADHEIYDYPGEFEDGSQGEHYSKLRIEEMQARHETAHAQSMARGVANGHLFTLAGYPRDDRNKEYLVISATLQMDAGTFETGGGGGGEMFFSCSLAAIDAQTPFRSERITPKPVIQGPQTAIVVGPSGEEIHTDEHARVKVQFHWDREGQNDENSSCWIRVSQPWAGKGWGSMATPRIGQEVIVEFLEGDPDRPIITGRVYNGESAPPYGSGNGVVSGLKSQTHKGDGFNEMSMDDTAGQEKITIHAQYDMSTTVENDQTDLVHNNRTTTVDVDDTETIGNNQKIEVGVDQETLVKSNQKLEVGADQTVTIKANHTESVTSNEDLSVGGDQKAVIKGAQQLEVGADQKEDIGAARTIKVKADDSLNVSGGQTIEVMGEIKISSQSKITLSAGGSTIEIGPAGVTIETGAVVGIKGSTIKLN